ncbi:hypothetical protein K490DRAFT_56725 [Saccharata proteae CBS 121410]|uniref:Uncharacterized protein n=1 Tax=Saccharata proteae CBS 121410 TaxID=1314787 RepID=A0A9P4M076_9PEZI|nr:hypothetical protein K490DRAFT_56725 [Saccharata proteae CBS 121410]
MWTIWIQSRAPLAVITVFNWQNARVPSLAAFVTSPNHHFWPRMPKEIKFEFFCQVDEKPPSTREPDFLRLRYSYYTAMSSRWYCCSSEEPAGLIKDIDIVDDRATSPSINRRSDVQTSSNGRVRKPESAYEFSGCS